MSPPRVAIIGTNIGSTLHVRAFQAAGFEVAGFIGRNPQRTRERAAHFGVRHAWNGLEAALDSEIDAVVVASPPSTHRPFVLAALAAGKHVMCEKPLSLDLAEAAEMVAAGEASKVVVQLVHPHRWFARTALPRQLVREGALGRVLQVHTHFDAPLLANGVSGLPEWWLRKETGGGWLRNYGSHGIDSLRYMLGEIVAVSGRTRCDSRFGLSADTGYAFHFEIGDGAIGAMAGSCRARDFSAQTRVVGSDATLEADWNNVWIADRDGRREVAMNPELRAHLAIAGSVGAPGTALPRPDTAYETIHTSDAGFAEQVAFARSFLNRIVDPGWGHEAVATFADGLAHMKVIEAVEQSQRERRWIECG